MGDRLTREALGTYRILLIDKDTVPLPNQSMDLPGILALALGGTTSSFSTSTSLPSMSSTSFESSWNEIRGYGCQRIIDWFIQQIAIAISTNSPSAGNLGPWWNARVGIPITKQKNIESHTTTSMHSTTIGKGRRASPHTPHHPAHHQQHDSHVSPSTLRLATALA